MKKKILILTAILVVSGLVAYNYLYQSHRDIANETVSYSESAKSVFDSFQKSDSTANAKYLDQTIEIYGKITNLDLPNKTITVDEKVLARCTNGIPSTLKLQDFIALKGRVVGYDDLLEEVQMDQCTIKKQ